MPVIHVGRNFANGVDILKQSITATDAEQTCVMNVRRRTHEIKVTGVSYVYIKQDKFIDKDHFAQGSFLRSVILIDSPSQRVRPSCNTRGVDRV